ncbi:type VII secretion protein EccCa [Nocardioides sp. dk4132]|uniref:type VII secretion protein EccCa n=1 Tax=unclassified Nocardioides TaxID=2615069 RepID=UPI001294B6C6|nr:MULTISPECIES: type VII secretion protein EccCa [unclassified Nocardioides]MQW78171.1 type VII secretion protein EccCa [Nocardioides sp. dk4132]QGA06185.1 type VII secretion protein EccCa [Nocardioides sp. dk884]
MTTVREAGPLPLPSGRIVLKPPPELRPAEGASGVLMNAVPMLGGLGSVVLVATMGGGADGLRLLAAGMFLVATVGFVVVQVDRQRTQRAEQVGGARADYLHHLASVRARAREAGDRQRAALLWHHPSPAALPSLAAQRSRVWERTAGDPEFLQVRCGVADQPSALELLAHDDADAARADPVAVAAARRLLALHRTQPDLPLTVDLTAQDRVDAVGPAEQARAVVRALMCSAAVFHPPDALVVAVLTDDAALAHWDWVKWLPHAHSPRARDAIGPRRLVGTSAEELRALLPAHPHLLLVLDDDGRHDPAALELPGTGATILRVRAPAHRADRVRLVLGADPVGCEPDRCDLASAEALARRLLPLGTAGDEHSGGRGRGGPVDFATLLGAGDLRVLDPAISWRPRPERDRLRVPIGTGEDGHVVHLDLKESARRGMGPHGLVIGATGSGKSELLRTLVLGLGTTHSPAELNLVLVDFKGGATFAGLASMPHVSAVITNLAEELALVDRMQDALAGELLRRQQVLRRAGNLASQHDYEQARAAGRDLAPLPSLLVVVDEFSELLAARPELLDLFVAIGRLGRSLGVHLLLASQRLEEGRLRGLESHLSYRVGLRTFSAQESRAVLGVPDAHELPPVPGLGYLRPDPARLVRFRAAYVSAPVEPVEPVGPVPEPRGRHSAAPAPTGIWPFPVTRVAARSVVPSPSRLPALLDPRPLIEVALARMAGHGPDAHRVWLPPLDAPETLDRLLGPLVEDPSLGLVAPRWRELPGLRIPVGVVDRPREQRAEPLTIDLAGAAGHVAVVGAPRSGKSTLLRTLVAALALRTTPQEAQFFVLDFGGGTFAPFARLPHVAGVASRAEPDVVRRALAQVHGLLDRREAYFREQGIDSAETYRARRAAGRADDGYGDVFVVVDGWSSLRAELDDLEVALQQLAARGLAFGVHLLTSAARWADYRTSVRDVLGTRIELRIGDPIESEVDRRAQALVPRSRPGRGLVAGPLHVLAAVPRIDGRRDADDLADGVADLVDRVAAAWRGPTGPRLRLLPGHVPLADVRRAGETGGETGGETTGAGGPLLLGLRESDLAAVELDVDAEPHLLALGDSGSGKTSLLRAYVQEVMRTRSPRQAQVVLVDPRRSLLGEVPDAYLLNHLSSAAQVDAAIADLAAHLQTRLPGPGVSTEQLRSRSWWSGAEVFVVADDHDLLTTSQGSPLQRLQPLLAQARDVGLHLALARRVGGAARAWHEPVLQTVRDLGAPGLLLSGRPEEGPLLAGLRPASAPPGRGRLVTRGRGVEVVQVAWQEPAP